MTHNLSVKNPKWTSLLNLCHRLSTYSVMAVVGPDTRAVVIAAAFCNDVRKLGFLEPQQSRTPITAIQDNFTVDVEADEITEPSAYGRRWTQVVISESDVFDFLGSRYGLSPLGGAEPIATEPEPAVQHAPVNYKTNRKSPGLDYRKSDVSLVRDGVEGVGSGLYLNATDAARALAKKAEGNSAEASKAARLAKQIKAALRSDSDG
jgi:hypothetical protein